MQEQARDDIGVVCESKRERARKGRWERERKRKMEVKKGSNRKAGEFKGRI